MTNPNLMNKKNQLNLLKKKKKTKTSPQINLFGGLFGKNKRREKSAEREEKEKEVGRDRVYSLEKTRMSPLKLGEEKKIVL